uniref:Putative secreted protein n=1 Tax=Ixodes ricinus TaxID=34613 RepID=A0A6B0TSY7_IXORI
MGVTLSIQLFTVLLQSHSKELVARLKAAYFTDPISSSFSAALSSSVFVEKMCTPVAPQPRESRASRGLGLQTS